MSVILPCMTMDDDDLSECGRAGGADAGERDAVTVWTPKAGQFLHSSCSAEDVYEVLGPGEDALGHPTLDVRVLDLNEILHFDHDDAAKRDGSDGKWFAPLTSAELPEGVHVVLRGLQYRREAGALADPAVPSRR